jgi:hypothetical protein
MLTTLAIPTEQFITFRVELRREVTMSYSRTSLLRGSDSKYSSGTVSPPCYSKGKTTLKRLIRELSESEKMLRSQGSLMEQPTEDLAQLEMAWPWLANPNIELQS